MHMEMDILIQRALNQEFLSLEEGTYLYKNAPTSLLMFAGNELRKKLHPHGLVTWIIDRNVNYTNVCVSGCKFCNFFRAKNHQEAYVTSSNEYRQKIEELFAAGGNQFLLQGGMHPEFGLQFYTELFKNLKSIHPNLRLHALGPPEIVHIAKLDRINYRKVLEELVKAGLDSLPGAGAEILVDRVRKEISPNKCTTQEWLDVMREAHKLNITTSATMMCGHVETAEERMEHLIRLREVQSEKPEGSKGFISFIPWPFQGENTVLSKRYPIRTLSAEAYIRLIAISRILLPNIPNIQASWLTVGKETGQLCLHSGANDFGSIMIEENVVSAAGANHKFDQTGIRKAIEEAGFKPQQRDQQFEYCGSCFCSAIEN